MLKIPLFDSIGQELFRIHQNYFDSLTPPGIPIQNEELSRVYGDKFIKGWRISVTTLNKRTLELDVLFDSETPFSAPRIALTDKSYFLKWPHVEDDGRLCLLHPEDHIIHSSNTILTEYLINEAIDLINKSESGTNREDFVNEFSNYWVYLLKDNKKNPKDILLLVSDLRNSRIIYYTKYDKRTIICETSEEGDKWIGDYSGKNERVENNYKKAGLFWLTNPLYPEKYPKNNKELRLLIEETDSHILKEIVPVESGSVPVILAFQTINGPATACVWLNEPLEFDKKRRKEVNKRFDGFKNKKNVPPEMYLTHNGRTDCATVTKVNKKWLVERSGTGFNPKIAKSKVCIIGCGSLGSGIARLLSQAGVEYITLIDNEQLSWNNIGRYLIGGQFVGQFKVEAIKLFLQAQYPGALYINTVTEKWQQAFKKNSSVLLNNDVIISTTGDWNSESSLNYLFNTNAHMPPVIYGWLEPYGICGHALTITEMGGCFSCGMTNYGKFLYPVTDWGNMIPQKREPACSLTYQPYGITDILPIQGIIVHSTLDLIQNKIKYSEHRTWIGNIDHLPEINGRLNSDVHSYYKEVKKGSIVTTQWKKNPNCTFKH